MADPKFVNTIDTDYPGQGRPLTSLEVDANFHDLLLRIISLEDGGSFGLASTEFDGVNLTFNWTSGPPTTVPLPVATFRARGVWTNDQDLNYLDVVKVTGVGMFLVLRAHTTPSFPESFDASAEDGTGEALYLEIAEAPDIASCFVYRGLWAAGTVYFVNEVFVHPEYGMFVTETGHTSPSTFDPLQEELRQLAGRAFSFAEDIPDSTDDIITLDTSFIGRYIRFENGGTVIFPRDVDFGDGNPEVTFRQGGVNPIYFMGEDTDVTVNPQREGFSTATSYKGAVVTAKYVRLNEWDLIGPYGDATL